MKKNAEYLVQKGHIKYFINWTFELEKKFIDSKTALRALHNKILSKTI